MMRSDEAWNFLEYFYGLPGVSNACLALQDECGADITLMLFVVYLGVNGDSLSDTDLSRLNEAVADWRSNVVERVRHARRAVRAEADPALSEFRTALKKVELEGERHQVELLAQGRPGVRGGGSARLGIGNLERYVSTLPTANPVAVSVLEEAISARLQIGQWKDRQ